MTKKILSIIMVLSIILSIFTVPAMAETQTYRSGEWEGGMLNEWVDFGSEGYPTFYSEYKYEVTHFYSDDEWKVDTIKAIAYKPAWDNFEEKKDFLKALQNKDISLEWTRDKEVSYIWNVDRDGYLEIWRQKRKADNNKEWYGEGENYVCVLLGKYSYDDYSSFLAKNQSNNTTGSINDDSVNKNSGPNGTFIHNHKPGQKTHTITCSNCGKQALINENEDNYIRSIQPEFEARLYCIDCQKEAISNHGNDYNIIAVCPNCKLSHILTYTEDHQDTNYLNNQTIDIIRNPEKYDAKMVKCCYCANKVDGNSIDLAAEKPNTGIIGHVNDSFYFDGGGADDPEPESFETEIQYPKENDSNYFLNDDNFKQTNIYVYLSDNELKDKINSLIDIPKNDKVDPYIELRLDGYTYLGAISSTAYSQKNADTISFSEPKYNIDYGAFLSEYNKVIISPEYGETLPSDIYWYYQYYDKSYCWLQKPTNQKYVGSFSASVMIDDIEYLYLTDESLLKIAQANGFSKVNEYDGGLNYCLINYVIIDELPEPVTGSITGSLKYENGNPMIDTKVWINEIETQTDKTGAFLMDNLPLGDYELYADLDGVKTKIKTIQATVYLSNNESTITELKPKDKLNLSLSPQNTEIKADIVITPNYNPPIPIILSLLASGLMIFFLLGKKKKKKEEETELEQTIEIETEEESEEIKEDTQEEKQDEKQEDEGQDDLKEDETEDNPEN